MKLQGMFRLPKNRKFGFQPRYYDEAKEDFDYRVARAKQEAKGINNDEYVPMRHGELRKSSNLLSSDKRSSTTRTIIIMAALLLLAYWLLYS